VALALRVPLVAKQPQHDENYNRFPYLATSPAGWAIARAQGHRGSTLHGWAADWPRQIVIHPPGVSAFYWAWIRVFGDSAVALHVPTIILGTASVLLTWSFAGRLFGSRVALPAALAVCVSLSHVEHSTQAVHAIFETALLVASLIGLQRVIEGGRAGLRRWLWVLNLLGIAVSYHYAVFLALQTVLLWQRRKALRVPRVYFVAVGVAALIVAAVFTAGRVRDLYTYEFWPAWNLAKAIETLRSLPENFYTTEPSPIPVFRFLGPASDGVNTLFMLMFAVGAAAVLPGLLRDRGCGAVLEVFPALLVLLPLAAYLVLPIIGVGRFGEPRNFFYLLPVYFVVVFDALARLRLPRPTHVVLCAALLVTLVATGAARGWPYWREVAWRHLVPAVEGLGQNGPMTD
jgi:hypothetical protein